MEMVLTKDELIQSLNHEVQILLHLISKIDPSRLDYRPTPGQRSTLELLQYIAIMGPIHVRGTVAPAFSIDEWRQMWQREEPRSKGLDLESATAEIARHREVFSELIAPLSDAELRANLEMFGSTVSRGSWLVRLVLNHYVGYRMQLFLYLKASGREELSTMNLWAGVDPPPRT